MPTPPAPGGVAMATMVSSYIVRGDSRFHAVAGGDAAAADALDGEGGGGVRELRGAPHVAALAEADQEGRREDVASAGEVHGVGAAGGHMAQRASALIERGPVAAGGDDGEAGQGDIP